MIKALIYLWQFPQNLLGYFILMYHKNFCKHGIGQVGDRYYVVKHLNSSGISLGKYIIFDSDTVPMEKDVRHEQGHQKQSLILGWLYLPVIGLPSAIGNILHRFIKFEYYKQPWEAWADRLGGVER